MSLAILIGVVVGAFVAFGVALRNATELLRIRLRGGEIEFVRGRVPHRLGQEIAEVLAQSDQSEGRIWIRVEGQQPRVLAQGLSEGTVQQLRNVVGQFSVAQWRNAPRVGRE